MALPGSSKNLPANLLLRNESAPPLSDHPSPMAPTQDALASHAKRVGQWQACPFEHPGERQGSDLSLHHEGLPGRRCVEIRACVSVQQTEERFKQKAAAYRTKLRDGPFAF